MTKNRACWSWWDTRQTGVGMAGVAGTFWLLTIGEGWDTPRIAMTVLAALGLILCLVSWRPAVRQRRKNLAVLKERDALQKRLIQNYYKSAAEQVRSAGLETILEEIACDESAIDDLGEYERLRLYDLGLIVSENSAEKQCLVSKTTPFGQEIAALLFEARNPD